MFSRVALFISAILIGLFSKIIMEEVKSGFSIALGIFKRFQHLVIALLVVGVIFGIILINTSDDPWSDLAPNVVTDVVIILITIFIIDRIVERQEHKRLLPFRAVAFNDVSSLISEITYFWGKAYTLSVPHPQPTTVKGFFTVDTFGYILKYLDLDKKPNVLPEITWWEYFDLKNRKILSQAERILDRHILNLDAEIYQKIQVLTTTELLKEDLTLTKNFYEKK